MPCTSVTGKVQADPERDLLKIAVVNRYAQAPVSVGFIRNFGIRDGAIASSVAHDSHNIIAVGSSDEDLSRAVNLIMQEKRWHSGRTRRCTAGGRSSGSRNHECRTGRGGSPRVRSPQRHGAFHGQPTCMHPSCSSPSWPCWSSPNSSSAIRACSMENPSGLCKLVGAGLPFTELQAELISCSPRFCQGSGCVTVSGALATVFTCRQKRCIRNFY